MIKSIQHSVLILSVVALFSACTESNKKESTEIPVATEKTECLYLRPKYFGQHIKQKIN